MLDQVLRRIVLSAAAPALLIAAVPTRACAYGPVTPPNTSARTTPSFLSFEVVAMTNFQRERNGCDPLAVDQSLATAATRQSSYMAHTGLFTHVWRDGSTFVARAHDAGYQAPSGENIAWGFSDVRSVMVAWMASPGHRENILNCAAHSIGTGVVYGANGVPYYTQEFGY